MSSPLKLSDYARLIGFLLLLLPVHVLAVVPVVLLAYSLIRAQENRDFSRIEKSVYYVKIYLWLAVCAVIATQLYLVFGGEVDLAPFILVPILAGVIYTIALNGLFLAPLSLRREWVEEFGVFRRAPRPNRQSAAQHASFVSPADEIAKLAKLKADGHISASEYERLKSSLFSRE